jgi:phosphoribosyl 1,2-cyclic phosphodiesterase
VKVTLWGTRGSIAAPGVENARYGGNTACVEVRGDAGTLVVLDAGTGLRRLGAAIGRTHPRIDLLLTHLHMDHIQGLGFFAPLFDPDVEVHIWGPATPAMPLRRRLMRYLAPPLFPVHLRDVPNLVLHDLASGTFTVGEFRVTADLLCHPGFTLGYRLESSGGTLAYLSDHEPALGHAEFPGRPEWTSGYALARDADLLVHDAQYGGDEYPAHVGWGHSAIEHTLAFAALARVRHLVTFHHDPAHSDDVLDRLTGDAVARARPAFVVSPGTEGTTFVLGERNGIGSPASGAI